MTTAILAMVRVLAPELSAVSDAAVQAVAAIVAVGLDARSFGARATEAAALLTAHQLTLQARAAAASVGGAGVGAVTSIRTGDLSLGFGALGAPRTTEDDYYRQTSHGLAFLSIRDSRYTTSGILT